MRNVADEPKVTQKELVDDQKTVGTTVTMNTTDNTRHHNGLKSCSPGEVPLLNKEHVKACLTFSSENLNESKKA